METLEGLEATILNPGEASKHLSLICREMNLRDIWLTPGDFYSFTPEKDVLELMLQTDNRIYARKTPFPDMYFPLYLEEPNMGIQSSGIMSITSGDMKAIFTMFGLKDTKTGNVKFRPGSYTIKGETVTRSPTFITMHTGIRQMNNYMKKVMVLWCNLIDFITMPDVEYKIQRRNPVREMKRAREGKPPLPTSLIVRVKGNTKRYLSQYTGMGGKKRAHEVRGHYRHLHSDWYKNKQGDVIWVPPHIRGEGVPIKKDYQIIE